MQERDRGHLREEALAVLADRVELHMALLAGERAAHQVEPPRDVILRHGVPAEGVADHLLARPAEHALGGAVHVDALQARVPQHERILRDVEHRPVLRLALLRRLLGPLALGDVAHDHQAVRPAEVVHRHAAKLDVEERAVGAPRLALALEDAPFIRRREHAVAGRDALGRHQALRRHGQQRLARVAEHREEGRVGVDEAIAIHHHHAVQRGVEGRAVLRLALARVRLGAAVLELGLRARGEDLQHRLDQARVLHLPAQDHRHQPDRPAPPIAERAAGVALHLQAAELAVRREDILQPRRVGAKALAEHRLARRAADVVLEVLDDAAVGVEGEHLHARATGVLRQRDEGEVGAQDRRERAHELAEDVVADRARDRERGGAQRLFAGAHVPGVHRPLVPAYR